MSLSDKKTLQVFSNLGVKLNELEGRKKAAMTITAAAVDTETVTTHKKLN